ncbi:MAG: flagellar hook-basal body complex protein [Lachnospiraceae bacterium]|nr:flagellar hook-basal body complex protein [Lachnospiraceae bacterium]
MMRSLFAGVSGLRTHQTKMDVIGNNIANVNTVAYKSSSITFSELMYQTTQGASAPTNTAAGTNPKQIGLGVTSGAINTSIATPGATQNTGNPFDLRITGDAFFVVRNGESNYFTRDGSFFVDGAGNLAMQSTGYNVMGWGLGPDGNVKSDTLQPLKVMSPEVMTYGAEATSLGYFSGIIDRLDSDVTSSSGKVVNFSFFDNAGYQYTAKFAVKELGVQDGSSTRDYSLELTDVLDSSNKSVMDTFPGISLGSKENYTQKIKLTTPSEYTVSDTGIKTSTTGTEITFADLITEAHAEDLDAIAAKYGYSTEDFKKLNYTKTDGTVETIEAGLTAGGPNAALNAALSGTAEMSKISNTTVLRYNTSDGSFNSVTGGTEGSTILDMGGNTNFSNIAISFKTTSNTNNNKTSTLGAKNGDTKGNGTGRKTGKLEGVAIENTGIIYATYTNGQKRILGQIAVAEFANASGLEKEGENLYSATSNSGDFDGVGVDVTANGGKISTGVLEMSNVDLSSEFTEMITTQRGFQANSRIITVSDTMLEELVNLKR